MLNEAGYNRAILRFRDYMKSKLIDPHEHGWEIMRWLQRNPDVSDRLDIDVDDLEEMYDYGDYEFYTTIENIVAKLTRSEIDDISDYMMSNDPAEAPTWAHMDYTKTIRPGTWLVHFSDNAYKIAREGFNKGIQDMGKLGLTTHLSDRQKEESDIGGYNFAFEAGSRYASQAAKEGRYGKDAVMFRSAGVESFHYGDSENQIVFFGAAIDPGQIVLLTKIDDEEWCVEMTGGRRDCAYIGRDDWKNRTYGFDSAVNWVMNNFDQYRKRIVTPHMKWQRQPWL